MERIPLPGGLAERAAQFAAARAAGGVAEPVTPRLAATVILLRPAGGAVEVYVQRRAATMAFAAGMYAFPGGSVDPSDSLAAATTGWHGPPPQEWAPRLGLPVAQAEGVICAAVRELYEEAGVLLAGTPEGRVVADLDGEQWEADRLALQQHQHGLAGWLATRGLVLRADLLVPWARWLTPDFEPRRYDTFFFLAVVPAGQSPRQVGGEADRTVWLPPAQAAELPMLPPTRVILGELAHFDTIDEVIEVAAGRDFTAPHQPFIEVDETGVWLRV